MRNLTTYQQLFLSILNEHLATRIGDIAEEMFGDRTPGSKAKCYSHLQALLHRRLIWTTNEPDGVYGISDLGKRVAKEYHL